MPTEETKNIVASAIRQKMHRYGRKQNNGIEMCYGYPSLKTVRANCIRSIPDDSTFEAAFDALLREGRVHRFLIPSVGEGLSLEKPPKALTKV